MEKNGKKKILKNLTSIKIMSSTNRSNARNTHISDYYVTPKDCIKQFFGYWLDDLMGEFHDDQLSVGTDPNQAKWLDPCAGGDDKHGMSYPEVIKEEFDPEVMSTIDVKIGRAHV